MVASKETLDALGSIGLNMYQRKIYSALLSRGVSTAGELSEMTGVPRSRSYDVLESLADMGFAILKPSKPREYVAIPPYEALENVKELQKGKLKDKLAKIEKLRNSEAVQELNILYNEGVSLVDPADLSGALKGRYNLYQHLGNLIKSAEQEVKLLTTETGLKELAENYSDILSKAKARGVRIKIIAPITSENKESYLTLKDFADVRLPERENLSRISIIDGKRTTMALTHEKVHPTQDTAFWTDSSHLASGTLNPLFDMLWNSGKIPEKP